MHHRRLRGVSSRLKGFFEPSAMGSGLRQAQPSLSPKDAGHFLDQMLLGRSLRRMFGDERGDQGVVFVRILPRQDGVARQDAMAERIEAADLRTGGFGLF